MKVLAPFGAFVRRYLGAMMRSEAIPADDKAPPPIVAPAPSPTLARTSPTTAGQRNERHDIAIPDDDTLVMFGKPAPIEEPDTEDELRAHLAGQRRTETIPLHEWKGKVV